jgi:hypothetical protein
MKSGANDKNDSALTRIFWAGLAAGTLDITAAFVTWAPRGVMPMPILQGIASGFLGPKSFGGGWETAALGATLHFFIAFSAAAVFYLLSRKLKFMTRRPLASGICYGIAVYFVMYWIVIPLSRFHRAPSPWSMTAIATLTHIVCVGIPIALVISAARMPRFFLRQASGSIEN